MRRELLLFGITIIIVGGQEATPTRAWAQAASASYRLVSQGVTSGGGAVVGVCSTGTLVTGALGVELIGRADGTQSRTVAGIVPTWPPVVITDLNGGAVINELAWSGSDASTADEWIELRNRTDQTVDVSGWQITYDTGAGNVLMVTIPPLKTIPPRGFFLIANFTAAINPLSTTLTVLPDVVDPGVFLSNTNLKVRLYRGSFQSGPLVDTAGNGGAPLAGSTGTGTHRSMERREIPGDGTQAASWRTAVAAVNFKVGATERGTPRVANTEEIPPAAITNLTALPDGVTGPGPASPLSGRVLLTWTAPGDDCDVGTASAYFVRYATFPVAADPEAWWSGATPVTTLPAPLLAGTTQTVAVDGLTVETKYFWAIRAQDAIPNLGPLDFRTQGGPALQAQDFPNGLRPPTNFASIGLSTGVVRFTWTDNSSMEDLYRISNCMGNGLFDVPTNSTSFLAAVPPNTPFGCSDFGVFENTISAFSFKYGAGRNGTIMSAFSLTNVPTGLTAPEAAADHVRLTWAEVDPAHPASRYAVERSSDSQQTWVAIATWTTNVTTTTFTDTTIVEGSTLAYRVRGFNGNQIVTAPTAAVAVVIPRVAPAAVTDLAAQPGGAEGSIRLTWTAPGDDGTVGTATTYLIRQSTVGAITTELAFSSGVGVASSPPAPLAGGTTQAMTVTGLDPGVTYYFALKTLDESGNASPLSNSPAATAGVVGSAIRINEVAPGEPLNGDWIEFFVARAAGNLSGWTLRASTGTTSTDRLVKTFPAITPQKSDFVIVEWKANPPADDLTRPVSGVWRLYVDTGTGSAGLIATDNAITLMDAGGAIHDFMAWGNQDGTWVSAHQAAADAAVAAGQWRRLGGNTLQFDCPSSRTTGTAGVDGGNAIARNETATDEGHKGDWSYQTVQTKGAANGPRTTAPGLGTAKTDSGGTILAGGTTTLLLTYTAANPNTDTTRHVVTWDIPLGWSVPQSTSSTGAGFATTTFAFTSGFSLSVIGRTIILPVGNMANGAAVTVEYRNAVVQASSGTAAFLASADDNGTNVAPLLAGSPSLNVISGGAGAPRMARPQSPGLGVPPERVVAGPNPVVGGGPANLWFYADWPQWTAKVALLNGAGERVTEGESGGEDAAPTRAGGASLIFERAAGAGATMQGRPYDGNVVRTYAMSEAPYIHRAVWNGRSDSGAPVASGVYMMVFDITNPETGESQRLIRKLLVIR